MKNKKLNAICNVCKKSCKKVDSVALVGPIMPVSNAKVFEHWMLKPSKELTKGVIKMPVNNYHVKCIGDLLHNAVAASLAQRRLP